MRVNRERFLIKVKPTTLDYLKLSLKEATTSDDGVTSDEKKYRKEKKKLQIRYLKGEEEKKDTSDDIWQ